MTVGLIRESLKHCERKTEKSRTEILTNSKQKYEVQQKFEVLQFHTLTVVFSKKKIEINSNRLQKLRNFARTLTNRFWNYPQEIIPKKKWILDGNFKSLSQNEVLLQET